jgi:hypothetical protein
MAAGKQVQGRLEPVPSLSAGEVFSLSIPKNEELEYYHDRYGYVEQLLTQNKQKYNEIAFVSSRLVSDTGEPKVIHSANCLWIVV